MVSKAFNPAKQDELARAIEQLSPDEAAFFLAKLEAAIRKRKIQLTGYLVAMLVWLVGTVGALVYYGATSNFRAWVFLIPFALVGGVLYGFGAWANRAGQAYDGAHVDHGSVGPGAAGDDGGVRGRRNERPS